MPRCGEGTIAVSEGDIVIVTRWQRCWVYGDKRLPQGMCACVCVKNDARIRMFYGKKLLKM